MLNRRQILRGAAVLAATGCARKPEPAAVRELSVSLSEHLSVSSVYLAEELGLFAEAGFRLNRVRLSARDAIPVLAGGKLDVTFGGIAASLMTAVANGMAIRVVAGREIADPDCGESFSLYAHKAVFGSGPVDPQKLRGRRISVRIRGIAEFLLDTFLKWNGIPHDAVEKVDLPLNEAIAALASRRIDALLDTEFARSPVAASGQIVRVWRYADAQPGHQYSFILFGKSMLEDAAGAARFLAAYIEGSRRFLRGETPKFMTEFATTYGLNVDETVKACRKTFREDGSVDLPSVERMFAWQFERGYATAPLSVPQLVDARYLGAAHRMLADGSWRVNPGAGKAVK
jgi:ABC-type nitrate/sulfonate/bicarbonate transport system substrate-binding protein